MLHVSGPGRPLGRSRTCDVVSTFEGVGVAILCDSV